MSEDMENVQVEFSESSDHDGIAEGHGKVPGFFKIYVAVTIVWMVIYVYRFTPMFTGWTQTAGLQ